MMGSVIRMSEAAGSVACAVVVLTSFDKSGAGIGESIEVSRANGASAERQLLA